MDKLDNPVAYTMDYKGYTIRSDDHGVAAYRDVVPVVRSSTLPNLIGVLDVLWEVEQRHKDPAYQRERLEKIRTIALYGDDRIIDRVVERTYARHPASSTKRGAAASATHNPHHRPYKIFAVDFDGCLCTNAWPGIGAPNTELIESLKRRRETGDKLILWTCREGALLDVALEWCRAHGLEFDAVNENLPEMVERYGGDCRKISADEYWDDKAVNVRA